LYVCIKNIRSQGVSGRPLSKQVCQEKRN